MSHRSRSLARIIAAILVAASWTTTPLGGQAGAKGGEWPTYGGDLGHTRYAPLEQITPANFSKLEIAWRFKTDFLGPRPEFNLESTPLMVNGRLFSTAGTRRAVVALDAATGEMMWMHSEREGARGTAAPRQLSGRGLAYWTDGSELFRTIPQLGEFGNETWEKDSWRYSGNTGVWAQISVDEELGMAYLPVELPTHDYYGGERPGNTLFAESLVAVDLQTGQRKWHYQLVHHGVWDMDIPCAPILADITVNGRTIKAVAQPTKQAFLYVFDRVTGQPIWPIEERPAPKGDVPGEVYSPTQPFPTKPPAYDRQGLSVDDLIDFTPELRAEAVKAIAKYKIGPVFTPPVVSKAEGPIATLTMAAQGAATNWPGGSYDPETHVLYVYSQSAVASLGLVPPPPGVADVRYHQGTVLSGARRAGGSGANAGAGAGAGAEGGGAVTTLDVQGLPLVKPPYGRISAINLDKGEISWQVAHGETPDRIRNHPALKGLTIPRTGRPGTVGTLVTRTLLIAGEPGFGPTPSGERGSMLRAYAKASGKEVGAVYMPAPQSGSPMTYMLNGKQYLVVAVSGGNYAGELLAFKLAE